MTFAMYISTMNYERGHKSSRSLSSPILLSPCTPALADSHCCRHTHTHTQHTTRWAIFSI